MPARDLLIKNGYVVTMDPDLGDLARADVHICDGNIQQIGIDLPLAKDARVIDADEKVVLPGLVDTHRHVWQGAIGGSGGRVAVGGYVGVVIAGLAPLYEPEDVYAGTLWGALQAVNAGVTTLADWSHIVTTPEHADANIQALHDSGIRGIPLRAAGCGGPRRVVRGEHAAARRRRTAGAQRALPLRP
jgi:cytosine/adenosine deaminase-related metal-dependent hydrolase